MGLATCLRHGVQFDADVQPLCTFCLRDGVSAATPGGIARRAPPVPVSVLSSVLALLMAMLPTFDDALHPVVIAPFPGKLGNEPGYDSGGLAGHRRARPVYLQAGDLPRASVWAAWTDGRPTDKDELDRFGIEAVEAVQSVSDRADLAESKLVAVGPDLFAFRLEIRSVGNGPRRHPPMPAAPVTGRVNSERDRYEGPRTELRALVPAGRRAVEMALSAEGRPGEGLVDEFDEWFRSVEGARPYSTNYLMEGRAGFVLRVGMGVLFGFLLGNALASARQWWLARRRKNEPEVPRRASLPPPAPGPYRYR